MNADKCPNLRKSAPSADNSSYPPPSTCLTLQVFWSRATVVDHSSVIIRDMAENRWLRFQDPCEVLQTSRLDEVMPLLQRMEARIDQERLYAAGWVSYEAAPAFDPALAVREPGDFPLLWFGLYRRGEPVALPRPPATAKTGTAGTARRVLRTNGDCPLFRGSRRLAGATMRQRWPRSKRASPVARPIR